MRKKILTSIFVCTLLTATLTLVFSNSTKDNLVDLTLTNVEALASGEGSASDYCERYCESWEFTYCYLQTASGNEYYCFRMFPKNW